MEEKRFICTFMLTDNIQRINQQVELITDELQGVVDFLWVVQDFNAECVWIIFHRKWTLDPCCIGPARQRGGVGVKGNEQR